MTLSVIIVNYNVKQLLKECLQSVMIAAKDLEGELWVVDNNSSDGSLAMLQKEFPTIKLIANKKNPGFSVANNQAIRQAKGEHILLLNPDTLVQADCFQKCLNFMEQTPKCGALGVQMHDAKKTFLPESKRGLPTPWVSFTKMSGLNKLFPRSPIFNRYHLGYLDKDQNHPVDVLAGAFMWVRKSALEKVGLLDESFFMYGEDIDLSYRIQQGGWENWYLGEVQILHYKGESTNKYTYAYIHRFYGAMRIFAKKHFSTTYPFYAISIQILIIMHSIKLLMARSLLGKR
ncbi:MAG: glycosyltransferase family 2 protein [Bacteroidetes bacterium]|nr:glycosyltransferase family 2 protein [Bacteroidota bacterium]